MKRLRLFRVLDHVWPVKYLKEVKDEDGKVCRGTWCDDGIEVTKGPNEKAILRHEGAGHGVFRAVGLDERWEERFGTKVARELEEEVVSHILPVYLEACKRNGVL